MALFVYQVTQAQLAQTTFMAGASGTSADLFVIASDGQAYSNSGNWSEFHVNVAANQAPMLTVASSNVSANADQMLPASSLFSATDADNDMLSYLLYDATPAANSGHFVVNGQTVPAQNVYQVTQAQLAQTTFVAGASGASADLFVIASDGQAYSNSGNWSEFHVNVVAPQTSSLTSRASVYGDVDLALGTADPQAEDFTRRSSSGILLHYETGGLADWFVSNGTYSSVQSINTIPSGWSYVGTGDFNHDGTNDILLEYGATGGLADWLIQNGAMQSIVSVNQNVPAGWSAIGTGDFNGDGTTDLLLQSGATGALEDFIFQNGAFQTSMGIGSLLSGWSVIGTGDFNGEGTTDLLLDYGATNYLAEWTMHNGTFQSSMGIGSLPSGWSVVPDAGSGHALTGDFLDNGTSDILLQYGPTGALAVWEMQNGALHNGMSMNQNVPAGWTVISAGDYFGDGTTDLLLQYGATHDLAVWKIHNGTFQSAVNVNPPGGHLAAGWSVLPA
jgi:uncharacterized protein YbdZ (MbtH family)